MDRTSVDLLELSLKLAADSKGRAALISAGRIPDKALLFEPIKELQSIGVEIFTTAGTHAFLADKGVQTTLVQKISGKAEPNILSLLSAGRFDLVVNVQTGVVNYDEESDAGMIHAYADRHTIPFIKSANQAANVIRAVVDERRRGVHRYKANDLAEPWNLKRHFMEKVVKAGGFVCHHAHFDKAYLISDWNLKLGQVDMQEKWRLYQLLKKNYTHEDLIERIQRGVDNLIAQGASYCRTMVDADSTVELRPMEAALEVKRRVAGKIQFDIGVQVLQGVVDPACLKWYEKACELADFCGGLPSRDRPLPEKHLDIIMRVAKNLGKPLDVHVDQENNPSESETAMLAAKTIEHGMEGRVFAIHAVSVSAKDPSEQDDICKRLKDADVSVIICPSAALSMRQLEMRAPLHNSIAPLVKLLDHGVDVCMGVDNVYDLFMPFCDGDMWTECRMLMETTRFYELDRVVAVATNRSRLKHRAAEPASR